MADFPERPATFNARWWSMLPESTNIIDERRNSLGRAFGPAPTGLESMFPAQRFADMADNPEDWGAKPAGGGGEDPTAWGATPVEAAPQPVNLKGLKQRLTDLWERGRIDPETAGTVDPMQRLGRAAEPIVEGFTEGFKTGFGPDEIGLSEDQIKQARELGWGEPALGAFGALDQALKPAAILLRGMSGLFRGGQEAFIAGATPLIGKKAATDIAAIPDSIMGSPHPTGIPKPGEAATISRVVLDRDGKPRIQHVGEFPAQQDFKAAADAVSKKPDIIGGGDWNGLELNYEVRAGGKRQNVAPDGSTYETSYTADYGEIKGTRGGDGDPLDFYMGPNPESQRVFVIDEISQTTGKWKQTKPMLGFNSEEEAVAGYLGTSTKSPKSVGAVTEMTVDEFKQAVGARTLEQPVASPSLIEKNMRAAWDERGIHPAEVFEDAQRDAFVRSELAPPSFDGWHGGAPDIKAFDLTHIGSGEGTSSRGHGVYIGEAKGTGEYYRDFLSEHRRRGETGSALYRTRVYADQRLMLDLDRPMSEQPAVMERLIADPALEPHVDPNITGEMFRNKLADELGLSEETVSNRLDDVGVPGFKYLDEASRLTGKVTKLGDNYFFSGSATPFKTEGEARAAARAAGNVTRNVVIFDPKRIEITHKNGVELERGDRFAATNSPVMPGTPLSELARTGERHVDAVLNDPVVKRAIDNAVISRDYDVPNGAGASKLAPDPTIYIDRRFPRTMEVDGVRFDPAEPFIIRETVALHVTDALVDGGMDRPTAQRVALGEYAAKAEAQWYAAHAIDQAKAEAAYKPIIDRIEATHTPPDLYTRQEARPTDAAEIADARAILGGDGSPIAAALDEMVAGRGRLVEVPEGDIMLRSGTRPDIGNTLEISRVNFEGNEGKGAFTRYLAELEQQATDRGFDAVYVEQIHNKRLEAFLRRRGYRDAPAGVKPDQATLYKPVNIADPREDLWSLIKINAPLELIEQHPMVHLALEEARALPRTGAPADFKSQQWRAARTYDFNGERVQGTDAAVQRLIDQAIRFAGGKVATEKRAILVIGPPAAGKSSISDKVAVTRRAAIVDADEAKQVIPEYKGGVGAGAVHEESSVMAKDMLAHFGQDGSNIVLPKVGEDPGKIRELSEALKGRGYTVDLIHVAATPEISRRRNITRFLQLGRLIDPAYVAEVGDKPRDTFYLLRNEGLYDETADISTVSRQPTVISGDGPVASFIRARNAADDAQAAAGGDQVVPRAAAAGADLTRPENLTSPRLNQQPAPPPGSYVNAARAGVDKLMNVGRGLQHYLDPMATGSNAAMVIAKDAISVVRRIHWEHGRLDAEITRRFSPEQWERMWNAADEESVLLKSGEKGMGAAEGMGLNTLTREERLFVDYIQADSQEAWLHAIDAGMVEGEGLPSYTPRMVLNVTAGLEDLSPRSLNELGRNVFTRTSQMKHRRHLLAEETEAAAKEMVARRLAERGASAEDIAAATEKVKLARNIRTLPLAAARLKEAAVWRDMVNKIEEHGKAAGQPTVWTGEAPGKEWFTIEGNPAFTKWEPVLEKVQDVAGEPYWQPVRNSAGDVVMQPKPIYLSGEFKGPMDAILDGGWRETMTLMGVETPSPYGALMAVKSRSMLAILNSPLIHNMVVLSKVLEASATKTNPLVGFSLYRRGNDIVNGPPQRARELIERGLAPMGPRGAFQDVSSMMERPAIAEDHHVSWTGKVLAAVPHLFDQVVNREPRPLTREQATDKMRTLISAGKPTPAIAAELNLPAERVDTFRQSHDLVQSIAKETDPNVPHPLWDQIYREWEAKYPGAKAQPGDITDFVSRMSRDRREGLIAKLGPEERAEYDARQARTSPAEGGNLPEREEGMLQLAFSDAEQMGGAQFSSGDAVERGIAKLGNFYHNTMLWDRVRDLQFGLADHLSDRLVGKGVDRLTADRVAGHFSNIIVGSIPKEAMSAGARGWANLLMFSRSFTLGNLSTYKQAVAGLPKPILAQIERDFRLRAPEGATPEELASLQAHVRSDAQSISRRKALATLALSYGLYQVGNALLQHGINIIANDSTVDEELRGYARRFSSLISDVKDNPFELRHMISRLNPTSDNEPHKGDRVHLGWDKDGTAIYGRNPMGKFGEELVGYPTMPMEMVRRKASPTLGFLLDVMTNDKGFGHKVYNELDDTLTGDVNTVMAVAKHLVMKHLPEQQLQGLWDLAHGEGDPTVNKLRAFGPLAGFTTSVGMAGGEARGEVAGEKQQFDARFNVAWPDIRKQIQRGDVAGAREVMNKLAVTPRMQEGLISNALDPSGALRGSTLRNFYLRATPQQIERFERAQQKGRGPTQPGATP